MELDNLDFEVNVTNYRTYSATLTDQITKKHALKSVVLNVHTP